MPRNYVLHWIGLGCLAVLCAAGMLPPKQPLAAQGDARLASDVNTLKDQLNRLQRDHADLKRDYENLKREFDRQPKELARELAKISDNIDKVHSRIDGLKLKAGNPTQSLPWDCGKEQKEDPSNLRVMYGLRDGSGCKVQNINYYKELSLEIPRK